MQVALIQDLQARLRGQGGAKQRCDMTSRVEAEDKEEV